MERMKKRFGILALVAVVTLAFVLVSAFASRMYIRIVFLRITQRSLRGK